jgi:hypothetical protein
MKSHLRESVLQRWEPPYMSSIEKKGKPMPSSQVFS